MTINNVKKEIEKINEFLLATTDPWFHFYFTQINELVTKVVGSFDFTHVKKFDTIEIEFSELMFIKTILYGWDLQKENPFIEFVTEDECLKELKKLGFLSNEYYAFKINTDRNEPVLIVAKGIKCSITKVEITKFCLGNSND